MKLLIANSKGGVSKTTIATNLATWLANVKKENVAIVDLDHNHNTTDWGTYRSAAELPDGIGHIEVVDLSKEASPISAICELEEQYKYVIIDAGGYDSASFRECLVMCDDIIVPCKPNQADIDVTGRMLETIEEANVIREGVELDPILPYLYFTQVNSNPRVTALQDAVTAFKKISTMCKTIDTGASYIRQAYPTAYGMGLGVIEMKLGATKAIDDVTTLAKTVFGEAS